ncbi:hypothetical protein LP52_09170 [Streptomonospora alba]|uniref:Peptidase U62 n=2 Tax=Streptomonospora alba TaxID=183763 RepID=A0A0C2G752_9ACTN|nr:hypothetical protein LP52_09170 [Streptomonospora alba]
MPETAPLIEAADAVVEHGTAVGADGVEAYVCDEHTLSLAQRRGADPSVSESRTRGMGVRVVRDRAVGFAYATLSGPSAAAQAFDRADAACGAAEAASGTAPVLPAPEDASGTVGDAGLWEPGVQEWSAAAARERLAELAAAAEAPGEATVLRCQYGVELKAVAVANSRGVRAAYRSGLHFLWAEVGDGSTSTTASCWSRTPRYLRADAAGADAATRIALDADASPPPGGVPVVFAPAAAARIIGRLAGPLSAGDARGRGRPGARVTAPAISVADDATIPGALASAPADGEGLPARRAELVEHGLRARSLDAPGVGRGHARRSGYRAVPRPGPSNLFVRPGRATLPELLAHLHDGVLVTEVGGLLAADPRSPRIALTVRGRRVIGGAPAHPVAGPLTSGSLWKVLHNVRAVGADLEFWPGAGVNAGSPSLLVEGAAFPGKEGKP